jgi:ABC-type sulfate/molybdate transport systems ATPase subunit
MNAAENIAFGMKRRREKRATVRKKIEAVLDRVDLAGFGEKKIEHRRHLPHRLDQPIFQSRSD